MYCYVCKEVSQDISHHSFPKQKDLREKWLQAFKLTEDGIFPKTLVCGKHFESSLIYKNCDNSRSYLKPNSVPTLLLEKRSEPTKRKRRLVGEPAPRSTSRYPRTKRVKKQRADSTADSTTNSTTYTIAGTITAEATDYVVQKPQFLKDCLNFSTLPQARENMQFALQHIEQQNNSLRLLYQVNRKMQDKFDALQTLLIELRNEDMISEVCECMLSVTIDMHLN